ncbi:YybH family protein [Robertkochia sediminum]|uniref:YybH family protein n=1 Tax=Robertkochia sediminum TaxID=2785326 RepID=UPI001931CB0E|nr:nuclear transport factor 2 family protein [Robertkochia sediminum]MBL7471415.1 nuclear transport factor 2 family protein [Robertkochia sediminum]
MKSRIVLLFALTFSLMSNAQIISGDEAEGKAILEQMRAFSAALVAGDGEALTNMYTDNAKIFPAGSKILSGDDLKAYWNNENEAEVTSHNLFPEEIHVSGDTAYDYGYYSGTSQDENGETVVWKGKYVVVWKKTAEGWKMYLDSWSRVVDK